MAVVSVFSFNSQQVNWHIPPNYSFNRSHMSHSGYLEHSIYALLWTQFPQTHEKTLIKPSNHWRSKGCSQTSNTGPPWWMLKSIYLFSVTPTSLPQPPVTTFAMLSVFFRLFFNIPAVNTQFSSSCAHWIGINMRTEVSAIKIKSLEANGHTSKIPMSGLQALIRFCYLRSAWDFSRFAESFC